MWLVGNVEGGTWLDGVLWEATEVPERYFTGWSIPREVWGLYPKLYPSLQLQSQKKTQKHPAVKSSRVSICQGEMAGESKRLLQGQCTNFVWGTYPGLQQREDRVDERHLRRVWVDGSGVGIKGTAIKVPVLSYAPYCRSRLSQASTPL